MDLGVLGLCYADLAFYCADVLGTTDLICIKSVLNRNIFEGGWGGGGECTLKMYPCCEKWCNFRCIISLVPKLNT